MDEKVIARFWSKVDKNGPTPAHCPELGPCWVWTAGRNNNGYGDFGVSAERKHMLAHRCAWELTNGPIPDGLCVLHNCDGGALGCVRPDHLRIGTQRENIRETHAKGRIGYRPRGAEHRSAKLTEALVRQLRAEHAAGVGSRRIARRLGMNRAAIWQMLKGKTWKHVK